LSLHVLMALGTRPQFIKSAPVIHECLKRKNLQLDLIDSGQHYDYDLAELFFKELQIPSPRVNLKVGSGSHATQTGKAMVRIERCIEQVRPDMVIVVGDTNTTLAGALAAAKLNVPLGHIEAGARSYEMNMPEEINRRVTDHVSTMLFAPTRNTVQNLRREGIQSSHIIRSGDTLVDALKTILPEARRARPKVSDKLEIRRDQYVLVTAHRPANVDFAPRLGLLVKALLNIAKGMKVILPAHPRLINRLHSGGLLTKLRNSESITVTKPLGYLELVGILEDAHAVLTDSGGLQKEAFLLGVPCVTMRKTTEWPETLRDGANRTVDLNPEMMVKFTLEGRRVANIPLWRENPFGSGASRRIVDSFLSRQG
jgi:UDP-N-acetylglucosamine 2-epimerase